MSRKRNNAITPFFTEKKFSKSYCANLSDVIVYQVYIPQHGGADKFRTAMKTATRYKRRFDGQSGRLPADYKKVLRTAENYSELWSLALCMGEMLFSASLFHDYALLRGVDYGSVGETERQLDLLCHFGFAKKLAFKRKGQPYPYLYVYSVCTSYPVVYSSYINKTIAPDVKSKKNINPEVYTENSWKAGESFQYARTYVNLIKNNVSEEIIKDIDISDSDSLRSYIFAGNTDGNGSYYFVTRRHEGEALYISSLLNEITEKLNAHGKLVLVTEDTDHISEIKSVLSESIIEKTVFLTDNILSN